MQAGPFRDWLHLPLAYLERALLLILTWEEDIKVHAVRKQGWTISAIARHLGRDRRTVRAYLSGDRNPGRRKPAGTDTFAAFTGYASARAEREPAPVGDHIVRRTAGPGVWWVVPDVDPSDP